jgi:Putative peptidoglycan binding domain
MELLPEFEAIINEFEEELHPEMEFELLQEVKPSSRKSSQYIKWVQSALNQVMGLHLAVDGRMGRTTRSAIRSFQKKMGLSADGIAGPKTEVALGTAIGKMGPAVSQPFHSTSTGTLPPPQQSLSQIVSTLRFDKAPLPVSLNSEFEKAAKRFISILSNPGILSSRLIGNRAKDIICILNKLRENDSDDRVIPWCKIRPTKSRFTASWQDWCYGKVTPVDEDWLYKNIRSKSDVEKANQQLDPFIDHLKVEYLYLHIYYPGAEEEASILPSLEEIDHQMKLTTQKLYNMSEEGSFQSQFGSGIPVYYEAIKNWIAEKQRNNKSVYSCGL